MGKIIKPLSGRGKDIYYKYVDNEIKIKWGDTNLKISKEILDDILKNFFIDADNWYPLGASMTNPIKSGLGKYLLIKQNLSPRYASLIASIMYDKGLINYKMKGRIDLKKINMKTIKYNKLVRDKIPEIIENDGKISKIKKVKGEEVIKLLNKKLDEELSEYKENEDIEELADLVEVVYGILHHKGMSLKEFERMRTEKNRKRGSFNDGILLLEVIEGE